MRESASTAFLLSVLDDAVFVADESAILLANPAFEELIEFTSAELASPRPPCFACPEEQITFFAFVQRQLSEGGTAPGQHAALVNLVARNGGPLVVQVKFRPFTPSKEDGGRPTCFYFASDKLKWREVLSSPLHLQPPFKCVVEGFGAGTTEPDFTILHANKSFADIACLRVEELRGRTLRSCGLTFKSEDAAQLCEGTPMQPTTKPLVGRNKQALLATVAILGADLLISYCESLPH